MMDFKGSLNTLVLYAHFSFYAYLEFIVYWIVRESIDQIYKLLINKKKKAKFWMPHEEDTITMHFLCLNHNPSYMIWCLR